MAQCHCAILHKHTTVATEGALLSQMQQEPIFVGFTAGTATPTGRTPAGTVPTNCAYAADVRDASAVSIYLKLTGGTTGATMTIETTADPAGVAGWASAAVRGPGGTAYATTATTLAAGAAKSLFLDPTDNISWVRPVLSANDGTLTGFVLTEQ